MEEWEKTGVESTLEDDNMGILKLFGKEALENIQEIIAKVTGLGVIITDYRGEPLTKMTGFTPFCQHIRQKGRQRRMCNLSDAFGIVQAAVTQKSCIYFCPCGLLEVAIPIVVQGQFLGGFLSGQVRCPDAPEDIPRFANLIRSQDIFNGDDKAMELYEQTPIYDYKKFLDIAELVSFIINQLSENEMASHQQYEEQSKEKERLISRIHDIEYEKNSLETELVHLKAQMNPYFIMNRLTDIANLAVLEGASKTNEMAVSFAEYLKYSFYDNAETILLTEEFENIERYLTMIKIKYDNAVTFSVTMKKEMEMQRIPTHILLPFVEKAVFHITENKEKQGQIEITAWYQEEQVCISVKDDASYQEAKQDEKLSRFYRSMIGEDAVNTSVINARQRLQALFGDKYKLIEHSGINGKENIIQFPMYFRERVV